MVRRIWFDKFFKQVSRRGIYIFGDCKVIHSSSLPKELNEISIIRSWVYSSGFIVLFLFHPVENVGSFRERGAHRLEKRSRELCQFRSNATFVRREIRRVTLVRKSKRGSCIRISSATLPRSNIFTLRTPFSTLVLPSESQNLYLTSRVKIFRSNVQGGSLETDLTFIFSIGWTV